MKCCIDYNLLKYKYFSNSFTFVSYKYPNLLINLLCFCISCCVMNLGHLTDWGLKWLLLICLGMHLCFSYIREKKEEYKVTSITNIQVSSFIFSVSSFDSSLHGHLQYIENVYLSSLSSRDLDIRKVWFIIILFRY